VLWPTLLPLAPSGNDSSIVIEIRADLSCAVCLSGLFLGDLGEQAQRIMQARRPSLPVDVVKVSHHGSGDQYPTLYRALRASVALIGVGAENSYGHPTASILRVLAENSVVIRSDEVGTITLHKNPTGDIVVFSER